MPFRWAYLKRFLAGAIFGLYMAHLLYFLNPQVEITRLRLASVTVIYGLICGLLFGSILWGFRALRVAVIGKPEVYRTHGFGFVVLAAFASAFIYWVHLGAFRIYLPVGAVRILSKSTNVITATAFVLLALWVVQRNADRARARAFFVVGVLVVALSGFFLFERRESYRTERKNVVVATMGAVAGERPVLLVAIRNLPYDWIVTMKGEGSVPFLEKQTDAAFFTRLEPFPSSSPKSLWASLATGKLPYRHGVTGRYSYTTPLNRTDPFLLIPNGIGFSAWGLLPPVERISAQLPSGNALPLWGIFQRLHLPVQVIAWPAAAPMPRLTSRVDARRFSAAAGATTRVVTSLESDLAALDAASPGEAGLTAIALEGFSAAQRALHIYTNELPQRGTVKGNLLREYVRDLDAALASLAARHPQHVIVICSPTAIVPPPLADAWSLLAAPFDEDDQGADDGFLMLAGPDVVHRENPPPVRVVDVVPTVLFAAGLPLGRDLDGGIATDAFSEESLRRSSVSAIQTYEAERLVVRRAAP